MQGEVLDHQEEQGLPEQLHKSVGVKKLLRAGIDASEDIGSPCGWDVSHGEETDGSCGTKEEHYFVVPVHGGTWLGSGR